MTDQRYYQTERETKKPNRNEVPFIVDVLRAKPRRLGSFISGQWCHCDAEILDYGNMWKLGDKVFQHVTISDGHTEVEVQVEIYDETDAYDVTGWHEMKLKWVGTPTLDTLKGIIGTIIGE